MPASWAWPMTGFNASLEAEETARPSTAFCWISVCISETCWAASPPVGPMRATSAPSSSPAFSMPAPIGVAKARDGSW